jgi:hypothetical protein
MQAMEYQSAFKRKKILTYPTTWKSLEDIILGEKDKYCMVPLIRGT